MPRGRPRKNKQEDSLNLGKKFNLDKKKLSGRGKGVPADSWAALDKLIHANLRENIRARRWSIFFRLAWLGVFVWVLSHIFIPSAADFSIDVAPFGGSTASGDINEDHAAFIPLYGPVISSSYPNSQGFGVQYQPVANSLKRAFENDKAKAIFLVIDSPGGDPVTASYIYNEIVKLREANPDKKVYAVIRNLGASAAYYIAAAAEEIYSHDYSLVGSIGVIFAGFGFVDSLEKLGIERRLYHAGRNKGMLDPFSPRNAEHDAYWQEALDELHRGFIQDVLDGRGDKIDRDNRDVFSGRIFTSAQAKDLGLVDGIGFFEEIVEDKTGLDNLVEYSPPVNPLEFLSLSFMQSIVNGLLAKLQYSYF